MTLFGIEIIRIERLNIRSATERVKTKDRYVLVSWSFYDPKQKHIYKVKQKQSTVIKVGL